MVGDEWVVDSSSVVYYWEHPYYPRYLVPLGDIRFGLVPDDALVVVDETRPDHRIVAWDSVDRWFEEDEEVFVHPRSPYSRVDPIQSNRAIRVEHGGAVLAEATQSVIVFETGLPPRYYLDRSAVDWSLLTPSDTVTSCPYKGTTSQYWNVEVVGETTSDIAWSYESPLLALTPITNLVAFYDEKVMVTSCR